MKIIKTVQNKEDQTSQVFMLIQKKNFAHETFHAMGLYHSFDDSGEFTFKKFKTDNIMDYSDIGPDKIPVISTWQWQWPIIQRNIDKEQNYENTNQYTNFNDNYEL